MPLLSRRELAAVLVAPLAAPVGYWLALTAYGVARWLLDQRKYGVVAPSIEQLVRPLGLIVAVGAPIAWAAALLAGLPLYLAVRADAGTPPTAAARAALLAGGAAIGFAVAWLMRPGLRGELLSIPFPPWLGALLGLLAAGSFLRLLAR